MELSAKSGKQINEEKITREARDRAALAEKMAKVIPQAPIRSAPVDPQLDEILEERKQQQEKEYQEKQEEAKQEQEVDAYLGQLNQQIELLQVELTKKNLAVEALVEALGATKLENAKLANYAGQLREYIAKQQSG